MDSISYQVALLLLVVLQLITLRMVTPRRRVYELDPAVIGDAIAAQLLKIYHGEIKSLSRDGVHRYARERYLQMASSLGLPAEAADAVADRVVFWLDAALDQSAPPARPGARTGQEENDGK